MPEIQLTVNGKTVSANVTEDMPLLWVLRDTMGLTGTKYGCGIGQCGACTVHLNGKPARSCLIPAVSVSEIDITTIEGIAKDGQLEPIQQVWIDKDVAQCGYCQAGQIMSALALLQEKPKPSDKDIDEAKSNVLNNFASTEEVARRKKPKKGDFVDINFSGYIDDKEIDKLRAQIFDYHHNPLKSDFQQIDLWH